MEEKSEKGALEGEEIELGGVYKCILTVHGGCLTGLVQQYITECIYDRSGILALVDFYKDVSEW